MIAFDTVPKGDVSPGLLGFLVVAAMGLALFLLVKSMRKQISKIELPSETDREDADQKPDGAAHAK
ncbi:hypothetical protein [Planomonospora parontospora]|uniref:hypothetical protein n=1 Tax=Planomonospora parontospora TaxID=58119 RepID=UPI0016715C57|nr:hypothetical protein [Planomonospora parontospora]GGL11309.1 hypothetical protein GCM10014719_11490 [Planomonospora parontospora subsp. antibiotica]GII14863.1 hypothetical protein Ppa05_15890 [Planomonospora parontospora subsp. antibiotica]